MADSSSSSSTLAAATAAALPVGFRFRPTDEELVRHYLKAKIAGRAHPDLLAIPDVDLAAVEPWDLPARSVIKSDDPEWFFFAHRDRPKYPGKSSRSCRSTAAGYWKATGKDRLIRAPGPGGRGKGALIGVKKTLVFHRGRAPRGARTPWIMHEYTATEPHLQSGQDGSFVLYRLFNKQDEETPAPKTESPSMSSPGNSQLQADNIGSASMVVDKASPADSSQLTPTNVTTNHSSAAHLLATADDIVSASMVVDKASPSDSSRLTPTNVATVHSSEAHLLPTASDTHQTEAEDAALWNMFAEFPDLQAEQTYAKFPTVSSPMHPHTDFRFIGNMGDEQDFSPYLKNFLGEQDVQNVLFNPPYDEPGAGNAASNPTAATPLCSTGSGSWALYPQEMFDSLLEPGSSDMINSNGQGDWAASSSTQQPAAPGFFDLQQGTAARRIRLAYAVERASASQPILASRSESGDEAESCHITGCSSSNNEEYHVNAVSPTTAGDLMHIQGKVHDIPPQALVSPVEVAERLQHLSFNDNMSEQHAKPPRGAASLKQRIKQDSVQNARGGLLQLQYSGRVPGKSSKEAAKRSTRSLWLALLVMVPLLVLVGVWRSLSYPTA